MFISQTKAGLKLNIQKTNIIASAPITLWQTEGETVKTVTNFIFLGSKITMDSYCRHEIKRCLPLGRKSYDKPRQCIKKQTHYFADKGPYCQNYDFSSSHVCMWELDNIKGWALKNWCLQTVVLEETPRVPWTARRSNQSILKDINHEYSPEELMLKLEL